MQLERIQKILARAGIASRRKAEELIASGEVSVNGKVAKLGDKAKFGRDSIKVHGHLIYKVEPPLYLAFNKPKGVISMMSDTDGRPTLSDYLIRIKKRLFPIGRLDFNSDGLLLLTNDGGFAASLQKRGDIPRIYHVKVKGHPEQQAIAKLERGARIGRKPVRPHSVTLVQKLANKSVIEVIFLAPGAVDVKGLFESKGFLIEKITRTAIGHITLKGLGPGEYRLLRSSSVEALLKQPELGLPNV
ncbi:MAG: pseudouridine synthase [Bdellovibrionota bacterium]